MIAARRIHRSAWQSGNEIRELLQALAVLILFGGKVVGFADISLEKVAVEIHGGRPPIKRVLQPFLQQVRSRPIK